MYVSIRIFSLDLYSNIIFFQLVKQNVTARIPRAPAVLVDRCRAATFTMPRRRTGLQQRNRLAERRLPKLVQHHRRLLAPRLLS
jgi:hypothetical protein